ncbi:hypothetical protein LTR78_007056 [Recurvomyces mirabilis]|uniref:Uncharacterized protein n=1 Tax=Recurvomyces mirabilis TaxID=574656 RepID=A0AAE1BYR1_9PEZI|nr:hypothetical protein LTR78_007056 [Recurvomyces mirabilis]KAK5150972.1 hypothetical protein LTS14_009776 [Recurvomyces mirabilis]
MDNWELSDLSKGRHDADTKKAVTTVSNVPEKYRGPIRDNHDMSAPGKTQVLRRNFKKVGMIAFANSVMVVWETLLVVSGLGL